MEIDFRRDRESPILICKLANYLNICLCILFSLPRCKIPKSPQEPSCRLILVAQAKLLVTLKIFLARSLSSLLVAPLQKACRIVLQKSSVVVNLVTPLIDGIFRVVILSTGYTLSLEQQTD